MAKLLLLLFTIVNYCLCVLPTKDFKPNVFVFTDISNEPDDAGSLVRLLLYTNEINLKGIIATTSFWLNDTVHEEDIYPIIDGYGKVHKNLLKHSPDYPTADYLRSLVASSHPVYGKACFDFTSISPGAAKFINAVDSLGDDETMFTLVWGGTLALAEALREVRKRGDIAAFTKKLRIYAVSDQDDTGPWIRYNFPRIPYVVSITGYNQYGLTTWVGISGEDYNSFDKGGPDSELVSKAWLKEHIQTVGPLGATYPDYWFNMEGDTPATLSIIPNGLNDPSHPEYGGWGGRYILSDLSGHFQHYADVADYVVGKNNETFVSNKATVWRWRPAVQADFRARMQWTLKDFKKTSHAPVVIVNGSDSVLPFDIVAEAGSKISLDASDSYDLNGNNVTFKWFHYYDISLTQGNRIEVPEIEITKLNANGSKVEFEVPEEKLACADHFGRPRVCRVYHIILEVTNDAEIPLTAYKRFVIQSTRVKTPTVGHDEL